MVILISFDVFNIEKQLFNCLHITANELPINGITWTLTFQIFCNSLARPPVFSFALSLILLSPGTA